MTTVLFWDIDGTLLTTGGAGIFAWEEAYHNVIGRPIDLWNVQTAGLTDVQIAINILKENNNIFSKKQVMQMVRFYEQHLPASLPKKSGSVLPNVKEILFHLESQNNMLSILLTGNTRAGANSKLTYYKLDSFFSLGAFAEDTGDRISIAHKALVLAQDKIKDLNLNKVYVIGDTPHDIHCGRAIGAKTIAVASGNYSMEQLSIHKPWQLYETLPEPKVFFDLLGN